MAPGGTITGSTLPFLPGQPAPTFTPQRSDSPEPDVIREWRERRDLQIQHRDEVSHERKQQTIKEAQQNIDDFYDNYNNKKDKEIVKTRKEAEEFLANRHQLGAHRQAGRSERQGHQGRSFREREGALPGAVAHPEEGRQGTRSDRLLDSGQVGLAAGLGRVLHGQKGRALSLELAVSSYNCVNILFTHPI
jgi:hypothetical protein